MYLIMQNKVWEKNVKKDWGKEKKGRQSQEKSKKMKRIAYE